MAEITCDVALLQPQVLPLGKLERVAVIYIERRAVDMVANREGGGGVMGSDQCIH